MSTRLILVRHGRTAWNAEARFQGQTDIPLDETGQAQAAAMAPVVGGLGADALYSSDLARARVTAEAIAGASGLAVTLDERLREINVGTWSGKPYSEVLGEMPDMESKLAAGADFRRSPTGETAGEMTDRVVAALDEIALTREGHQTIVVGHGMALRHGLIALLGWDHVHGHALTGLWNCSWSVLERKSPEASWRLLSYNNVVPDAPSSVTRAL